MARRKLSKKRSTRRRRSSMSGVSTGMTNVLAMVAGAIAGRLLQNKLQDKVNPKLVAAGQIAAGIFLPKVAKSKLMASLGTGMIVNGGVTLANQFGVIAAVGNITGDYSVDYISGSDNLSILAGGVGITDQGIMTGDSDMLSVVAGDMEDMEMSGYDDNESDF